LKLSFKLSSTASAFSESDNAIPPGTSKEGEEDGTRITPFVSFHSHWFALSKDSSMLLH
jgi:hypothetical protein